MSKDLADYCMLGLGVYGLGCILHAYKTIHHLLGCYGHTRFIYYLVKS